MFLQQTAAARALMLALALAIGWPAVATAQHDHAAHAHVTAPPPPARPWAADAVLRDNMQRIHETLRALDHYEKGHMNAATAVDNTKTIEQSAADIFAHCKLTPEKDAVLHNMLMPLLMAAQKFKSDPQNLQSLAAMRAAVADYPRYFEASGWAPSDKPAAHRHAGHESAAHEHAH